MKTNKIIAAALLPLMFACTKENIGQISPENGKFDVTINVSPEDSKAYMDETHGLLWKAGDNYFAGIVKGDKNLKSNKLDNVYPYPNVKDNPANQASFTWTDVEEMGEYKFYYPYHSESNAESLKFWVPVYSKANFGNSDDIFAAVSTGMVTLVKDSQDRPNTTADTKYKVVGSYVRIAVYGKDDETVSSLHIKGNAGSLHGKYFIDPQTNEVSGYEYNGDDIVVDFLTPEKATGTSKDDAHAVYIPVLPGKSSKNTYTVATSKGFYKFESASELEFKNGAVYDIPLNLSSLKAKFSAVPEKLYIVGDATVAGWNAGNAIELTKVEGENKFVAENIILMNGGEGFKFLTEIGNWNNSFVNVDGSLMFFNDPEEVGKDYKFTVDKSGFYNLTVDFDNFTVKPSLVSELPVLQHLLGTTTMLPTSVEGEFKGVAYVSSLSGGPNNCLIAKGEQYYSCGWTEVNFDAGDWKDKLSCEFSNVTLGSEQQGFFFKVEYGEKYYNVTLNTVNNTVRFELVQGKDFWLVGANNVWTVDDQYKATADENGIVTWKNVLITVNVPFKIVGSMRRPESTYFWTTGEWYNAWHENYENSETELTTSDSDVVFRRTYANNGENSYEAKWKFPSTGTYTIIFDTKNLKIRIAE